MKVGVVIPTFRTDATAALATAAEAEAAGIDGIFCYDHLWPLGQPERPALAPFPVLGAIAARSERLHVGTLVARIGLVPNEVLVGQFRALDLLAPGRVLAGIGTGDRLSAAENLAYGVEAGSAEERRSELGRCAAALRDGGIAVWVGGGSPRTRMVAEQLGVAVNLWDVPVGSVVEQSRRSEVTWAGPTPRSAGVVRGGSDPQDQVAPATTDPSGSAGDRSGRADPTISQLLRDLSAANATWAVFAWPVPLEALAACARGLREGR